MPQYIQLIDGILCHVESNNHKPERNNYNHLKDIINENLDEMYLSDLELWQNSAVKTPFHDKQAALKVANRNSVYGLETSVFKKELSEGILIPDGLVEKKEIRQWKTCTGTDDWEDVGKGWSINGCHKYRTVVFAFLKESKPVEETNDYRQKLFDYMLNEHGVTLLESDMAEIENIINPKKYPYKF